MLLYHAPAPALFAEDERYLDLNAAWYAVGEILKQMPPGTVADLQSHWPVVAPMSDQLHLFCSPDFGNLGASTECYLYRPVDHEYESSEEFDDLTEALHRWLASPAYAPSVLQELIQQVVRFNYGDAVVDQQQSQWAWAGTIMMLHAFKINETRLGLDRECSYRLGVKNGRSQGTQAQQAAGLRHRVQPR